MSVVRLIICFLRLKISNVVSILALLQLFLVISRHLLIILLGVVFSILKFAYSPVKPSCMEVFEKQCILLVDAFLQFSILACVDHRWLVEHLNHLIADVLKVLIIFNVFYHSVQVLPLSYQLKKLALVYLRLNFVLQLGLEFRVDLPECFPV